MPGPLIFPLRFARQPQYEAPIDWSNSICRGLDFAARGNFAVGVKGERLSRVPGSGSIVNVAGPGVAFTGTAVINYANSVVKNGDLTILFVGNPSSSSSLGEAFNQSGTAGRIWLGANTDEQEASVPGQLTLGLLQTGIDRSSVKAAGATDGTLSCYLVKKSSGAGAVFKNGQKLTSVITGTLAGSPALTTDTISLGGSSGNGSLSLNASLFLVLVFNRALVDAECVSITRNPWQIFRAPSRIWVAAAAAVQIMRPASDISAGAWTPSTGSSLFGTINETPADDATYNTTPSASTFEVKLGAGVSPGVTTGHVLRYRAQGTGGLTVKLIQGASTVIATRNPTITPAYQTFALALTGPEVAGITDYGDLYFEFTST